MQIKEVEELVEQVLVNVSGIIMSFKCNTCIILLLYYSQQIFFIIQDYTQRGNIKTICSWALFLKSKELI